MIGLTPPGRARAWQIVQLVTTMRAAFPADQVFVARHSLGAEILDVIVSRAIVDRRELASWRPRGLRIAFSALAACADEAAVTRLVEGAVPKIARGAVVEIGIQQAEAENARPRSPRLGQRGDAEQLQQRLRGGSEEH